MLSETAVGSGIIALAGIAQVALSERAKTRRAQYHYGYRTILVLMIGTVLVSAIRKIGELKVKTPNGGP